MFINNSAYTGNSCAPSGIVCTNTRESTLVYIITYSQPMLYTYITNWLYVCHAHLMHVRKSLFVFVYGLKPNQWSCSFVLQQFVYQHDIRHHLGYVKRLLARYVYLLSSVVVELWKYMHVYSWFVKETNHWAFKLLQYRLQGTEEIKASEISQTLYVQKRSLYVTQWTVVAYYIQCRTFNRF